MVKLGSAENEEEKKGLGRDVLLQPNGRNACGAAAQFGHINMTSAILNDLNGLP